MKSIDKLEDAYVAFVMLVILVGIICTIYDWVRGVPLL